ncbi:MAG TPA: hypothetical protein VI197_23250 [Polyangiaceae bacterium]
MPLRSRPRSSCLAHAAALAVALVYRAAEAAPAAPPATAPAEVPIPWKRWPLFDPFVAPREIVWFGGPASLRDVDRVEPLRGVTLGVAETIRETRGPFWLSLQRTWELRVHSRWTFVPILRYLYEGGLRLGGVEMGAGPTLIPVTLDISRGKFSFGGMAPGATARVGFKTGTFRVSLRAEREYLWRWLGQPSAVMTAFMIEIAGERPRSFRRKGHPIVLVD